MAPVGEQKAVIRFEDRDGFLYAYVSGEEDSVAISEEYFQRTINEAYKRDKKKLLIEENFPNQPSVIDIYTVTVSISKMLTAPLKIAFVDRMAEQNSLNMFAETVAVNRGVHGRVFSDIRAAEKWLKSGFPR